MRATFALVMLLSLSSFATAQEAAVAAPNKIKDAMEIMGRDLKAIATTQVDATSQASLVAKAQELRAQIISIVGETPEELAKSVPADQLANARLGYEKLMLQLAVQAVDLEVALRKGDQAQVKQAIDAMKDTKTDGHDQFKP